MPVSGNSVFQYILSNLDNVMKDFSKGKGVTNAGKSHSYCGKFKNPAADYVFRPVFILPLPNSNLNHPSLNTILCDTHHIPEHPTACSIHLIICYILQISCCCTPG